LIGSNTTPVGARNVRAFDAVYAHILVMSDALSDGIVKQFQDRF
jgi:hypothetical protein